MCRFLLISESVKCGNSFRSGVCHQEEFSSVWSLTERSWALDVGVPVLLILSNLCLFRDNLFGLLMLVSVSGGLRGVSPGTDVV